MNDLHRPREFRDLVELEAEVLGAGRCFSARVRDLSSEGLRLRSSHRMDFRQRLGLALYGSKGFLIGLSGDVRWVTKEAPEIFHLGVSFVFGPDTRAELPRLVWEIQTGRVEGALRNRRTARVMRPF